MGDSPTSPTVSAARARLATTLPTLSVRRTPTQQRRNHGLPSCERLATVTPNRVADASPEPLSPTESISTPSPKQRFSRAALAQRLSNSSARGRRSQSTGSVQRNATIPGAARATAARLLHQDTLPLVKQPSVEPAHEEPEAEQCDSVSRDVCTICLEPVGEREFAFPCGQQHHLHQPCAVHLLRCALSKRAVGLSTPPGGAGLDFKAMDAIEATMTKLAPEKLSHVCCPVCRRNWPSDATGTSMSQLRSCYVRDRLLSNANQLGHALGGALQRYEYRQDVHRALMKKAMSSFAKLAHCASTFFATQRRDSRCISSLIAFMHCRDVYRFSLVSSVCCYFGHDGKKLRVPHCRVHRIEKSAAHISAPELVTLQVNMATACHGFVSAWGKGLTMSSSHPRVLANWLARSSNLKELYLGNLDWESGDIGGHNLATIIGNKPLRVLDLTNNCLSDDTLLRLADGLVSNPSARVLEVLLLDLNCATERGLQALLPLGRVSSRRGGVREWGFRHNQIGDAGCRALAEARPMPAAWDLRTNGISAAGCEHLASAFTNMVVARLACNPIGDKGAFHLSRSFGDRLHVLDLRQSKLGDAGVQALGGELRRASSLKELLLAGNAFGAPGALALAEAWARGCAALRHVDLSSNPVGPRGIELMAGEMAGWTQSPFHLNLSSASCDGVTFGLQALTSTLRSLKRWKWKWVIDLKNNGFDPRQLEDIETMLEPGRSRGSSKQVA